MVSASRTGVVGSQATLRIPYRHTQDAFTFFVQLHLCGPVRVACTAAADKSDTSSDAYPEYEDEEGGSTGGGSGGGTTDGGVDGGGDDDGDDMESIAEALAQIAELGTTVAAQQAASVALQSEVATLYDNTYRWETYEYDCPDGVDIENVFDDLDLNGAFF